MIVKYSTQKLYRLWNNGSEENLIYFLRMDIKPVYINGNIHIFLGRGWFESKI